MSLHQVPIVLIGSEVLDSAMASVAGPEEMEVEILHISMARESWECLAEGAASKVKILPCYVLCITHLDLPYPTMHPPSLHGDGFAFDPLQTYAPHKD